MRRLLLSVMVASQALAASGKELTPPVGLKSPLRVVPSQPSPHTPQPSRLRTPPLRAAVEKAEYDERGVPKSWKYLNEQEWIVDSVGRDIAEIICFARPKHSDALQSFQFYAKTKDLSLNKYGYSLAPDSKTNSIEREFALVKFVWSPENYAPFAQQLLKTFDLKPSDSEKYPDDFVKKLCSAKMHVLIDESQRISAKLTAHPLDAELHEQSALLQAVFGLIDFSGGFCDTRVPLNRISAHLSMAKALRNGRLNKCGQLAEIALECLSSRDGIAVERCTELLKTENDTDVKSFLRAVKIRASGDYRFFDQTNHTDLEEFAFAMRSAWGAPNANLEYVKRKYASAVPLPWMRLLNQGLVTKNIAKISVEDLVATEKKDYLSDYNHFRKSSFPDFGLVKNDLNMTQTRCLTTTDGKQKLSPISWADIACLHARYIMWALMNEQHFYEHLINDDVLAVRHIERGRKEFGFLTLFPFLLRKTELAPTAQTSFFARAQNVFLLNPELVTCSNWRLSDQRAKAERIKPPLVRPEKFFNPSLPFGTAYWYSDRKQLANCEPTLDELVVIWQLAPCDAGAARDYAIKKYGATPTTDQWLEVYGPLAKFNLRAMEDVAESSADNPERCIALLKKLAEFSPSAYFKLAEYCQVIGRTDDAVKYAEMGIAKCPEPNTISNNTTWLMKYYIAHDLREKMKELYSENIKSSTESAWIQGALIGEHYKNWEIATKLLTAAEMRYGSEAAACAFYCRNRSENRFFQSAAQKREANFYPDGMRMMKLSEFQGTPQRGVRVTRADWMEPNSPLKRDCIMVAVDGIPIEDKSQLALLTRLLDKDSAKITFWDGTKFAETEKKFGFSKDFNLGYRNYFGPRKTISRIVGGKKVDLGDKSLSAIDSKSFGANRCGILGLSFDAQHRITSVVSRMPASVAGLRRGDQIKKIDNVVIENLANREISNKITGFIGTEVTFSIVRDGRELDVKMKRRHPIFDDEID